MQHKLVNVLMFLLSLVVLIISMRLFYNLAVYCDEYNASPDLIYGGNWGVILEWVKLIILFLMCVLSGIRLFHKR